MLLSVVFQQLYNIVDSIVAGKFVGAQALAAVGASYPITMIFMAIATGAKRRCGCYYFAVVRCENFEKLKTSIFTSIISMTVLAAILTIFGIVFCSGMLKMLSTPENIFSDSMTYLNIYIGGLIFLFLYNICTGIFTAMGDSKTPLYFLIMSSVGNIILDLVFVIVFNMGVAGVGWATFIAQCISSLLAFAILLKRVHGIKSGTYKKIFNPYARTYFKNCNTEYLAAKFCIGRKFIYTSRVNSFGSDVIAGYSAAIKLNTFAITSFSTLGNAMSSYTAQNTGARKLLRIPEGLKAGIVMLIVVSLPFFIAYFVFPNTMMNIFVKSSETGIIDVGRIFLKIVTPFYFVISAKLTFDGILRGAGRMRAFMASTFTDLLLRVILAYVFSYALNSEVGIWLSWPVGWTIAAVISAVFYFIYYKTTIKNVQINCTVFSFLNMNKHLFYNLFNVVVINRIKGIFTVTA